MILLLCHVWACNNFNFNVIHGRMWAVLIYSTNHLHALVQYKVRFSESFPVLQIKLQKVQKRLNLQDFQCLARLRQMLIIHCRKNPIDQNCQKQKKNIPPIFTWDAH